MSQGDKVRNETQDVRGRAKEAAGDLTGNQDLKAKGQKDQMASDLKNAGEKVKDKLRED